MDVNPYAAIEDGFSEPVQKIPFLKAWFLFFLLATFLGFGAGALVGGITGGVLAAANVDKETFLRICQVLGYLVSLPVSFACYRWSVTKYVLPACTVEPFIEA